MLIDVALALEQKFKLLSDALGKEVTVTTDEGYAEIIAEAHRRKTGPKYPIVVMRSGDYEYDRSRFQNDRVLFGEHEELYNGVAVTYTDFDAPFLPYNLHYQIDIIAETRRDIDSMVLWVMRNVKERDYIDVSYKDYDGSDAIYCSIIKRGSIVRADDMDGNVTKLRRRTFELTATTLIPANEYKNEPQVVDIIPHAYPHDLENKKE